MADTSKSFALFYRRAHVFFTLIQKMDFSSQEAFRRIYHLAPKKGEAHFYARVGRHVRAAMVEALTRPAIAYWVRMNLALRVSRKLAQTTGRQQKVQAIEESLESFHIAVDAFMLHISLEEAIRRRASFAPPERLEGRNRPSSFSDFSLFEEEDALRRELHSIREFKHRIIPGLVQSIRKPVSP